MLVTNVGYLDSKFALDNATFQASVMETWLNTDTKEQPRNLTTKCLAALEHKPNSTILYSI
jgi:hypothetical protein